MTARTTLLTVALASLLAAAGCVSRGDDATDNGTTPATDTPATEAPVTSDAPVALPAALDGRTFLSTDVVGMTLVEGSQVSLTFDTSDGETATVGGSAGCNSFGSPFWITDGRLEADAFSMTEMGCDQPLMDQDAAVIEFLRSRPAISLDGAQLTLAGDTVTMTFVDREVADPDRPLVGTTWTIDTVITETSASTVPMGITPTLVFEDDQVLVDTGCNTGSAPVTVDGDTITFGSLTLTEIGCAEDVATFEAHVVSVLAGNRTFEITADRLQLIDPATQIGIAANADATDGA